MRPDIDVTFDFRNDTPAGKDPDAYSRTLRRYHKLLWSKRLPGGEFFALDDATPGCYLHHRSAVGVFRLSSDAVIPTFRWNRGVQSLITPEELASFNAVGYTIGGMMLFPGNKVDGQWTINQARGCTRKIGDRFDLTLECIRRHYTGGESPLREVFKRYAAFFELFRDFRGYVEFFMLQDLVDAAGSEVQFSLPFDDFRSSPVPATVEEYCAYKHAAVAFVTARNRRIHESLQSVA